MFDYNVNLSIKNTRASWTLTIQELLNEAVTAKSSKVILFDSYLYHAMTYLDQIPNIDISKRKKVCNVCKSTSYAT